MNKKLSNQIFLLFIIIIITIGFYTFLRVPKQYSDVEKRELYKFERFDYKSFLAGNYQNNMEKALSDQFLGSGTIRVNFNNYLDIPMSFLYDVFDLKNVLCKNNYLSIDNERATFNCDDYIVYKPKDYSNNEIMKKNFNNIVKVSNYVDAYYYFINTSEVFDFRNNNNNYNYTAIIKSKVRNKSNVFEFAYKDFNEYKCYFYKNDHHWNYKGSYKAYLDIHQLLNLKDEELKPTDTFTNNEYFYGSHARITNIYDYKDVFKIYLFDIPNHMTYINGNDSTYGDYQNYLNHNYEYDKYENYYGIVYGGDYGEILFDFKNEKKDNLLIIANSFSNPINELIASHYNKTYVVDLRLYERELKKKFQIIDFIKDNNIDKVLFIISPTVLEKFDVGEVE